MAKEKIGPEAPLKPEKGPEEKQPEKPLRPETKKPPEQDKEKTKKKSKKKISLPSSVFRKKSKEFKEGTKEDRFLKEIEDILSQDIKIYYDTMTREDRSEFKKKGEETALKIRKIIKEAKVAIGKVVNLIKSWLLFIPEVNKYFLEQETKIKTDKILDLAKKRKDKKIE